MQTYPRLDRPTRSLSMLGLEFWCWGRLSSGPKYHMHSGSRWENQKRYCTVFRKRRRKVKNPHRT